MARMRQLKIEKQPTNRDSKSFDRYLTEINKIRLLTKEEEIALSIRVKNGDMDAVEKMCKANLRFVVSVAKQYQGRGLTLPDLISEGNVGLMKAVYRFDHTRGFKFISYAVWWIRQQILQSLIDQSRIIKLPMNRIATMNKMNVHTSIFFAQNGRHPSQEELAAMLQISPEQVRQVIISSAQTLRIEETLPGFENITILDYLPNEESPSPELVLQKKEVRGEIDRALLNLPHRDAEIVRLYYGLKGGRSHTFEEIGHKLDLTRERVRQLKERAIRRLRKSHLVTNL